MSDGVCVLNRASYLDMETDLFHMFGGMGWTVLMRHLKKADSLAQQTSHIQHVMSSDPYKEQLFLLVFLIAHVYVHYNSKGSHSSVNVSGAEWPPLVAGYVNLST